MSAPDGYTRAGFTLTGSRTLTDADAAAMIGHEISVSIGDAVLGSGIITDCRVVDDGARFKLTVEHNGRRCAGCGHVYTEDQADKYMALLGELRTQYGGSPDGLLKATTLLPDWVQVCTAWATCARRRMDDPEDDGESALPAGWQGNAGRPAGTCRYCKEAVFNDGMLWRHTVTELIPCAGLSSNASPRPEDENL